MAVMLLSRVRNFPVECIEKMYWIDSDNTSNAPLVEHAAHKAKPHPPHLKGWAKKRMEVRHPDIGRAGHMWLNECRFWDADGPVTMNKNKDAWYEREIKDALSERLSPTPKHLFKDFYGVDRSKIGRRGPKWQALAWAADKRG